MSPRSTSSTRDYAFVNHGQQAHRRRSLPRGWAEAVLLVVFLILALHLSGCSPPLACKQQPGVWEDGCTTDSDCVEKFGGTGGPDPG